MGTNAVLRLIFTAPAWDGVVMAGTIPIAMPLGSVVAAVRLIRLHRVGLSIAAAIQALQPINISTPNGDFRLGPEFGLGSHSHAFSIGTGNIFFGIGIMPLISLALVLLPFLKSPPSRSDRPMLGPGVQ